MNMRRSIIGLTLLALVATGAHTVLAGDDQCSKPCGPSEKASAASSCAPGKAATAVACENPHGKIAGNFDPVMSSACRFACATKLKYDSKDVSAQPGATAGKLTQCPVSGVVFVVAASRPRVHIAKEEYVTCCDKCAQKLRANPRHYLKA
jgi:hypothetical protein